MKLRQLLDGLKRIKSLDPECRGAASPRVEAGTVDLLLNY